MKNLADDISYRPRNQGVASGIKSTGAVQLSERKNKNKKLIKFKN